MAKRKKVERQHPQSREEGNKYDKVFQENMRELAPPLAEMLFGLKNYQLLPLPQVRLQTTREKDPDFLQIIKDERTPHGRLLHIEFEGKDRKSMDWDMQDYAGMAGKIHRMEIEQHLIFYGKGKPKNIKGKLEHTHYTYLYPVSPLSETSFLEFLHKDKPQVVIFAILANPEGLGTEEIARMILERLLLLESDELALRKFVKQLVMLSRKHNLQAKTIETVKKTMEYPEYVDDIFYIMGEEKGKEEGLEKGQAIKDIVAIRNMLGQNFALQTIAGILEVTQDYVLDIKNQLAKEPEIVALLKKKMEISSIASDLKVSPLLVEVLKKEHRL